MFSITKNCNFTKDQILKAHRRTEVKKYVSMNKIGKEDFKDQLLRKNIAIPV